ncbi:MAG: pyrroline-5-carboxylate reductase [Clostridia bacterium]|nr:pyrroline-5-carboxylate reductase [Clostridia bacterium]
MKIGFIGTGNMGGALAKAVAAALGGECLYLADANVEKAAALAGALGASLVNNDYVAAECDFVFLGVKPQMLEALLAELTPTLAQREMAPVLVSMAAGVSIDKVAAWIGVECPIIRIMPNTPVAVGEGTVLYSLSPSVTEAEREVFCAVLSAAGRLCRMPEKLLDAGTAVSGCGPAFVCLFIEALADGGVECGLPRQQAMELAVQTVLGTARQLQATESHPGALKDGVCSPGGSTIAGVHALEAGGFRSLAMDAVCAAYERTQELGK